jgi:hypothetical protein
MVVLLWLAGAVALAGLGRSIGGEFSDDFRVPGVESQDAIDVLREQFPSRRAAGRSSSSTSTTAPSRIPTAPLRSRTRSPQWPSWTTSLRHRR